VGFQMLRAIRDSTFKPIYLLGILVHNKKIYPNYHFLKNSQYWDIKKLKDYQFTKLQQLLRHAYNSTPFYKNRFDNNNLHPEDIKSLEDLPKIPSVEKSELIRHIEEIQISNYPEKLFFSETSGSSGEPLVFYRNMDWDAWHNASVLRGYSWYDVKPWERNGYLWGFNFNFKRRMKTKLLDILQNRFRLFSYDDHEMDKFIKKLRKAIYIGGYSSIIYEIAKRINKSGFNESEFSVKMIRGTSEKIFEKYQKECLKAFGQRMINEYGAAEAGIIAFECPAGNMHINMETVIVEVEDNEIVVTNLFSHSFPIIRYKLGDVIDIDKDIQCVCGMKHHIIKEITGRIGKTIYGHKSTYPSLTLYYIIKNLAIDKQTLINYQAVQFKKGYLELYLEENLSVENRKYLLESFENYFQKDMELKIVEEADLMCKDRKRKDFISYLENA